MSKTSCATMEDGLLHSETVYTHDTEPESRFVSEFRTIDPLSADCGYWVVDENGKAYGFASVDGQGCIARLEDGFRGLGLSAYVIWQCKNPTAASWRRWSEKWIKRMTAETRTGVVSCF